MEKLCYLSWCLPSIVSSTHRSADLASIHRLRPHILTLKILRHKVLDEMSHAGSRSYSMPVTYIEVASANIQSGVEEATAGDELEHSSFSTPAILPLFIVEAQQSKHIRRLGGEQYSTSFAIDGLYFSIADV